jgi:hypothetical protein
MDKLGLDADKLDVWLHPRERQSETPDMRPPPPIGTVMTSEVGGLFEHFEPHGSPHRQ